MTDLDRFEGQLLRFVGTSEVPEWVGADAVEILYPAAATNKNHSTYLSKVPDEWKGSKPVATPGGVQQMTTIFEPGLYYLIGRSDSPRAVPFQRWVFEEVLPSIRKTGGYSLSQFSQSSPQLLPYEVQKVRLQNIQLGLDIMSELGGMDEKFTKDVKDLVQGIVLGEQLAGPALPEGAQPKRLMVPVSDRVADLGYPLSAQKKGNLQKIGKLAAQFYRAKHDAEPLQREQYVAGATRMVNCYNEDDFDILDRAIQQVLGPLS